MCVLRCPLCNYIAFSYLALKKHIKAKHPLTDKCPICGKRCRNIVEHLHHEAGRGCEEHAVLYALYRISYGRRTNSVYKHSVELVFEKLCIAESRG